jgi:hypothetical protein
LPRKRSAAGDLAIERREKTMARINKSTRTVALQRLLVGVREHLREVPLHIGKRRLTYEDVARVLQANIDAINASAEARTAWAGVLEKERALQRESKEVIDGVKQIVLVMFGSDFEGLGRFGLAPRKRRPLDPATRVQKRERLRATRAARHTMGKRQREAITGEAGVTSRSPTSSSPSGAPDGTRGDAR